MNRSKIASHLTCKETTNKQQKHKSPTTQSQIQFTTHLSKENNKILSPDNSSPLLQRRCLSWGCLGQQQQQLHLPTKAAQLSSAMELNFKGERFPSASTNAHLYADWFVASNDGLYSEPPEKRCWHTLTSVDENTAVLFGGKGLRGMLNDVYLLDLGKQSLSFFFVSTSAN